MFIRKIEQVEMVKFCAPENSYDELEKFDVETFATDREFDEMLDGVFGAQDDDR